MHVWHGVYMSTSIFPLRMMVGQKALHMTVLALGVTVLLVLMVLNCLLYSPSHVNHSTPFSDHLHILTPSGDNKHTYQEGDVLALLSGVNVSMQHVSVPTEPAHGVSTSTEHASTEHVDLNVPVVRPTKHVEVKTPQLNASTEPVHVNKAALVTSPVVLAWENHTKLSSRITPTVSFFSPAPTTSRGYVFSVVYWEQLASSACNIMSLQCWAGRLTPPMFVVQPYYINGWPRTVPFNNKFITFSDLFDVDRWNNVSSGDHYATLVNWKQYRSRAPRDLIVVKIIYWWLNTSNSSGLDRNSRIESGCSDQLFQVDDSIFVTFSVVRKVCINLSYGDVLTLEEFNARIFGGFNTGSVSVVFKEWRGISARNKFRIIMNDSHCEWHYVPIRHAWSPSDKVKTAATQYIGHFLRDKEYVALMLRLEWAVRGHDMTYLQDVLNRVLSQLVNVQLRAGTNITFLTADVGRFGSATASSLFWTAFTAFFEQVYNGTMTVSQWENSFELISGTEDRDFVAMLQATIVSHAKCVIFVGHGNFQKHTKYMYEDIHGNEPTLCVEHIH